MSKASKQNTKHVPGSVLDHIWWANELAVGQTLALVLSTSGTGLTVMLPATTSLAMTTLTPVTFGTSPTASTTFTATLNSRALGDSNCTLSHVISGKVGLQASREAGDGSIWAISDSRRLRWVVIGFGECLGGGVVARVRAVVEVCGLLILRQPITRELSLVKINTYLVHIDPESVDIRTVDSIKEVNELLVPVLL